jgi:pimeloyl-ACP methyl ester carboxylesterase
MTIRKSYVEGTWGQVHVRMAGEGMPLLLLHQSPVSSIQFEAALPLLAKAGVKAIAIDTPGFGESAPPPAPTSIQAYADNVVAVMASLGLARAHVLGHHTGAAIAASLAARHNSKVDKLILNGVPLFTPEQRAFFATFKFGPLVPQPDGSHLVAVWNSRLKATPGWSDINAMHRYVAESLTIPERNHWGFLAAFDYDIEPDLKAISRPTLIFTNSGEDLYESSKRAAALREGEFFYAELDGGTHDIVDEQPQAWADVVARFLRA